MYGRNANICFRHIIGAVEKGFINETLNHRLLSTCSRMCSRRMTQLWKGLYFNASTKNRIVNNFNRFLSCRYYCISNDLDTSIASHVLNKKSTSTDNEVDNQLLKDIEKGLLELEDLASTDIKIVPTVVTTIQGEEVNSFACSHLDGSTTKFSLPRSGNKVFELFGTPDPNQPPSDIPCHGCGAHLHCKDPGIPGYLPSQAYLAVPKSQLKDCICQRCQLLKTNEIALDVSVSLNDYDPIIKEIKKLKALIVLLVDMTDLANSFHQTFTKLQGWARPMLVVGNKIDLIPKDGERYLDRALEALIATARANGFSEETNVRHFTLVSAKTGYGVEGLITKIFDEWRLKGHVYIVGCANSGKSTMFNTLLASDLCRGTAKEIIQRATTSMWPGTTLNLLKFPILNPKLETLHARKLRLERSGNTNEHELDKSKKVNIRPNLYSRISSTVLEPSQAVMVKRSKTSGFLAPTYSFERSEGNSEEDRLVELSDRDEALEFVGMDHIPYDDKNFKNWCFDTPGLINPDQVINLLNQKELLGCIPKDGMTCRTFIMKPGMVMFVSGLSRIDYVEGGDAFFSVFTSLDVPINVVSIGEADKFYKDNLGTDIFGIPIGDAERLKSIPELVGTDFEVVGVDSDIGAADIILSSLGWVTLTIRRGKRSTFKAYTPGAAGCKLRVPPLLEHAIRFRGRRIRETNRYKTAEEEEACRQRELEKATKRGTYKKS